MKNTLTFVGMVVVLLIVLLSPFATIWALNTLFPALVIPYTFWTWLSILILAGVFKTKVSK